MYYKKCPFCNGSVKEYYDVNTKLYVLKCNHCEEKGITLKIQSSSLEEIKELWNDRKEETDIYEIGRSNYGYLIFPDSEVKKCDDSHPEELLKYLGISTDIVDENNFDCEKICMKLGIIRIGEHCHCIVIEMPKKFTKKQIDKCINVIGNYKSYDKFYISHDDNIIYETNNINDLIIKLDGLNNEW